MRIEISRALALALLFAGCTATDRAPSPFALDSPGRATVLSGQPLSPPPFRARTREHARLGIAMRDAVARGDLDDLRRSAEVMDALPIETSLTSAQRERVEAMMVAARRARAAQDVRSAAQAVAALAESCGACHAAYGGLYTVNAEAPPDALGVEPRMRRHGWAAARLWEGLAAPSRDAWRTGARVLADAPLEPVQLAPDPRPADGGALAASVHELGSTALMLDDAAARAALYGELMTTCARCHGRRAGGRADASD
jgi:hypothetical protein